jgi:hypothetical protein
VVHPHTSCQQSIIELLLVAFSAQDSQSSLKQLRPSYLCRWPAMYITAHSTPPIRENLGKIQINLKIWNRFLEGWRVISRLFFHRFPGLPICRPFCSKASGQIRMLSFLLPSFYLSVPWVSLHLTGRLGGSLGTKKMTIAASIQETVDRYSRMNL